MNNKKSEELQKQNSLKINTPDKGNQTLTNKSPHSFEQGKLKKTTKEKKKKVDLSIIPLTEGERKVAEIISLPPKESASKQSKLSCEQPVTNISTMIQSTQTKKQSKQQVEQTQNDSINDTLTTKELCMKTSKEPTVDELKHSNDPTKSGGKIVSIIVVMALFLGMGWGYYWGQQKITELNHQIVLLKDTVNHELTQKTAEKSQDFTQQNQKLFQLEQAILEDKQSVDRIYQAQSISNQKIENLQTQINKISAESKIKPATWLYSEADFLLNNALRKLVLDNDIPTTVSLLNEADHLLTEVNDPKAIVIRGAVAQDLNMLSGLNKVNQNDLMQRLSMLANQVDELELLDVAYEEGTSNELSDSVRDWKQNIQKSISSFLDHFIRIKARNIEDKVLLAPNQDIYLRENIRLRLQIAILAIPRQQNELYKQSLEAVSAWVRSYFNVDSQETKQFLREIEQLREQSIYIDAPSELNSLNALAHVLNKRPYRVQKIQSHENNELLELNKDVLERQTRKKTADGAKEPLDEVEHTETSDALNNPETTEKTEHKN